jgi:TRAP-type mannitol/chloroaromatic compound transport system permease large subunit
MVVHGVMANASIGQLFAAGFVPGLMMAAALMVMVAWYARVRNYPRDAAFSLRVLWHTFWRAFLALLTPAIIIGGMMFGLFTPTEAAIAACVWALFLGVVVYRTLHARRLLRVSFDTIETTAVVLLIVAAALILASASPAPTPGRSRWSRTRTPSSPSWSTATSRPSTASSTTRTSSSTSCSRTGSTGSSTCSRRCR